MQNEAFYGADLARLQEAADELAQMASAIKAETPPEADVQPIVYFCTRIKTADSMLEKLRRKGLQPTCESALAEIYDAVGLRIVCSFASDVQTVIRKLKERRELTVLLEKDYFSYPKPSGYRSFHLCVRTRNGVLAEIQVRTIAMDFWATLEHQIQYKKNIENEALIRRELKRCADEIASTDLSMQTIREILKDFSSL